MSLLIFILGILNLYFILYHHHHLYLQYRIYNIEFTISNRWENSERVQVSDTQEIVWGQTSDSGF